MIPYKSLLTKLAVVVSSRGIGHLHWAGKWELTWAEHGAVLARLGLGLVCMYINIKKKLMNVCLLEGPSLGL